VTVLSVWKTQATATTAWLPLLAFHLSQKSAMDGAPVCLRLVEEDGQRRFRAAGSRGARVEGVSHIEEVQWDMRMGFIGGVLA
jgi:hypothetical protein